MDCEVVILIVNNTYTCITEIIVVNLMTVTSKKKLPLLVSTVKSECTYNTNTNTIQYL